jgi:hypothetical protein
MLQGDPMPATKSPKPSVTRKIGAGQILLAVTLLLVVLTLIAGVLWKHTQPERLTTLLQSSYTISGEHLYTLAFVPSLRVQSLHEPKMRTLLQEDPSYPFCQPSRLSIEDGNLYYAVEPHSGGNTGQPNAVAAPGHFLGTFLRKPGSLPTTKIAGQTRTHIARNSLPARTVLFRQLSLQAGALRDVTTLRLNQSGGQMRQIVSGMQGGALSEDPRLRDEGFCLIGSHVFWIRPAVEESEAVIRKDVFGRQNSWLETTAHSDLMLTALTDGKTRCIRHGIAGTTTLSEAGAGITWTEFAPYPRKPTVCYARASDGIVHSLAPATRPILTLFPEFKGRLYWTVRESGPGNGEVLMSSKQDGSDSREVLTQVKGRPLSRVSLYPYRGVLYCFLGEQTQPLLCRLHPDQSNPVEIVRKLPTNAGFAQFDGDYLYFVLSEHFHNFLADVTNNAVSDGYAPTLYRLPLDR